ncbi:hypothetical protein PPERSA_03758 [Pseudocohnilembus persalinus]|uniref:Uncharacterized protein n=1 Tax=Pseudocohnilembus persalinus TaxID=266149 RepID=A0A0V0QBS2_PSEPJ|nr:hypothetical protein PPERSA_03758 [Pseudocohnilembus persalinus]|eukprot:KRW99583.1 hypothetical protein PPERSA_03758 [Pseudocohnilembus persalinus]
MNEIKYHNNIKKSQNAMKEITQEDNSSNSESQVEDYQSFISYDKTQQTYYNKIEKEDQTVSLTPPFLNRNININIQGQNQSQYLKEGQAEVINFENSQNYQKSKINNLNNNQIQEQIQQQQQQNENYQQFDNNQYEDEDDDEEDEEDFESEYDSDQYNFDSKIDDNTQIMGELLRIVGNQQQFICDQFNVYSPFQLSNKAQFNPQVQQIQQQQFQQQVKNQQHTNSQINKITTLKQNINFKPTNNYQRSPSRQESKLLQPRYSKISNYSISGNKMEQLLQDGVKNSQDRIANSRQDLYLTSVLTYQNQKEINQAKKDYAFVIAFENKAHFLSFFPENNFEQILAKYKLVQKNRAAENQKQTLQQKNQ